MAYFRVQGCHLASNSAVILALASKSKEASDQINCMWKVRPHNFSSAISFSHASNFLFEISAGQWRSKESMRSVLLSFSVLKVITARIPFFGKKENKVNYYKMDFRTLFDKSSRVILFNSGCLWCLVFYPEFWSKWRYFSKQLFFLLS